MSVRVKGVPFGLREITTWLLSIILATFVLLFFFSKFGTRVNTLDFARELYEAEYNDVIAIDFLEKRTIAVSELTGEKDNYVWDYSVLIPKQTKVTHADVYAGFVFSKDGDLFVIITILYYKDAQMYFNPFTNGKVLKNNIKAFDTVRSSI